MNRQRRILLNLFGISYAALLSPLILASEGEASWKIVAKKLMQDLFPGDSCGQGADSYDVWNKLELFLKENPSQAEWIMLGFRQVGMQYERVDAKDFNKVLLSNPRFSPVVKYFHKLVVDIYYATKVGWSDVGVFKAPQPSGFEITSLHQHVKEGASCEINR